MAIVGVGTRAQAAPCAPAAPLIAPGVTGWAGPPGQDGALDDGQVPSFSGSGDIWTTVNALPGGTAIDKSSIPAFFDYTTVTAPYADAAGCMAYNNEGHQAQHDCLCQNCFTLMQECDAQPGCQAIWKCSADANCTDANSCYLLPGAPCVLPINNYGTGSVETGLEQALGACGAAVKPTACPSN
ncbi:MAG: hypothetical protein ACRENE_14290 [Polyangiaceae bacterium]